MSYKISAKNRKLKRKLITLINLFKFKSVNFNITHKFILIWAVLSLISLYMDWINSLNWEIVQNTFWQLLWISWYIMFILNLIILFIIFSNNKKEYLKIVTKFFFKDWNFIVILWLFNLLLIINNIFIIKWLAFFSKEIIYWRWGIISIIWTLFVIIWWVLLIKEQNKVLLYVNDDYCKWDKIEKVDEKNNMKLPF